MSHDPGQPRPDADRLSVPTAGLQELEPRVLLSASVTDPFEPLVPAGSSQDEVVAAAGGTQILGIDVSQFQGNINWTTVATTDREFAFIRAIDRYGNVDTKFYSNIVNAKNAGIWAGAYHFVTPWTDGYNDAAEEATLFANVLAPYITDGYLRPVIDIESYGTTGLSPHPIDLDNTVLTNWVHEYMSTFVSLTGVEPLIYTNSTYAKNAFNTSINQYDLWLARWTFDPNIPPVASDDGVWNGFDFWQYSDNDSVAGISGDVDGDVFFGSVAEMIAEYGIFTTPDDHGDDLDDATAITIPSSSLGEVHTIIDEDWFALTLSSGQAYTFDLIGGTLDEAEFGLYSETGTLLASTSGPGPDGLLGQLQYTPFATGTYHLRVTGAGEETGSYGLAVQETDDHGDSIAQATTVIGSSLAGIAGIQSSGDQDFFHFTAAAGKQYDFEVLDVGGLPDAVLTLYNAEGEVVDQQSGATPGGTHAQLTWIADAPAEMYFAVSAAPGSFGDYILTLNVTDAPLPLEGDLDDDGFVGIGDLNVVLGYWNQNVTPGDLSHGDTDGDGFIGIADLNVVLGNWNAGTPPVAQAVSTSTTDSASAPVTEPAAIVADSSERTRTRIKREPPAKDESVAMSRTDLSRGLAIANWRSDARSAFGKDAKAHYAPAIGLWEPDATA